MKKKIETQIDCYCPKCNQETHHSIHGMEKNSYIDEDFCEEHTFFIAKCLGCDHVTFLLKKDGDAYLDYGDNDELISAPQYTTYPESEGKVDALSSWDIPPLISKIYSESVKALNDNCFMLAAIGFRTTVEALCNEKGISSGKLVTKINKLKDKGIITSADCERLHQARFLGNDSTHEMISPERNQLLLVLEVINNILNNLYIIDEKCRNTFEYRFKDFDDFLNLLDEGLNKCPFDDSYPISGFLPNDRRYRLKDIEKYEAELIRLIDNGQYDKLVKCPEIRGKRPLFRKNGAVSCIG